MSTRKELVLRIQEDKLFQLNISFTDFEFSSHLWCFTDFVFMQHPQANISELYPKYLFCGHRYPWTLLYPSNAVSVWTVAKAKSHYFLLYQVISADPITNFYLCNSLVCNKFDSNSYCRSKHLNDKAKVRLTHTLVQEETIGIFTFHVMAEKTKYLQLELEGLFQYDFVIFDSPLVGIRPKGICTVYRSCKITMSSFQATVTV